MTETKYGLKPYFKNNDVFEIGVDEAGRGPLFGRVYASAVVLPKDTSFNHELMRDSKKFCSKTRIQEAADYIKQHAVAWSVQYADEKTIDTINIRQSVLQCMHLAIKDVIQQINTYDVQLLIDGNDFKPYTYIQDDMLEHCPYVTIKSGDNTYTSIAAASILAKVSRDAYILDLCEKNPELEERYGIASNKGYGAQRHRDGIQTHGITPWHRKTYGMCKTYGMAETYNEY